MKLSKPKLFWSIFVSCQFEEIEMIETGEKMGKCPFKKKKKKIQHFAHFPKLISKIPLF